MGYSNAAIMAHNMALAATELGVGTCYIWGAIAAVSRNPEVLAELKLPEGFMPCCAMCFGKTDVAYECREIPENKIGRTIIE